jgi:Flp pilus assembly pilin Flp
VLATFVYSIRTKFLSQEDGQSTVEYAALLTVIAIFLVFLSGMANELREVLGGVVHLIGIL